jgi:hypothetical protein
MSAKHSTQSNSFPGPKSMVEQRLNLGRRSHWERSTVENYRGNRDFEIMLKLIVKGLKSRNPKLTLAIRSRGTHGARSELQRKPFQEFRSEEGAKSPMVEA